MYRAINSAMYVYQSYRGRIAGEVIEDGRGVFLGNVGGVSTNGVVGAAVRGATAV